MAKTWEEHGKKIVTTLIKLSKQMEKTQKETDSILKQLKQIQKEKKKKSN